MIRFSPFLCVKTFSFYIFHLYFHTIHLKFSVTVFSSKVFYVHSFDFEYRILEAALQVLESV